MAHIAKYKAPSVGHMLAHYRRDRSSLERDRSIIRCFNQVYPSGILIRKERRTAVVRVHGNALKHGLTSDEVAYAWENPIRCRQRNGTDDPPLWISVGSLPDGRFAELIGFMDIDGIWCVFHAMVPPTKKFKRELGWR